jgi:hypothetical protein
MPYGFVVAVYVTTSAYVPFGLLVSAFAEYQTVVVSFKAFVAVVLNTWSDAVIPCPSRRA